jgi:hypothetical protein
MKPKILPTLLISALLILLTACGIINPSASTSGSSSSTTSNQQAAGGPTGFDPSRLTADQKLAIGTLKLEETSQAVTAEEAVQLLPLWKAVRSLGASSTASQDEVTALYQQIRETMTADQLSAIDKMTITTEDFTSIMGDFGVQNNPGTNPGTQSTRQANRQNQNFQGGPGGGPGGGAGGPPPGGDMPPGGLDGGGPMAQGTPQGTRTANRSGMGMMNMFIQPLINLLETRAGVATSTPPAPPAPPDEMITPTPTVAP